MKALLIIALALLFASPAFGDSSVVMRATGPNGDYVRLFEQPCANDRVRLMVPPQYHNDLRAGEGNIDNTIYGLCWVALPDGSVGFMFDDGDSGRLPIHMFKPEANS